MSETLALVAQTATVGDMLARAKPASYGGRRGGLAQNTRASLATDERYAAATYALLPSWVSGVFVEIGWPQVQQFARGTARRPLMIDAASKFKLGRVLPVDAADVDQAVQNAKLTFSTHQCTVFEASMTASSFDVDVVRAESVRSLLCRSARRRLWWGAAGKRAGRRLPLSAADVNTAVVNARKLTFDQLRFWAQTMANRLENQRLRGRRRLRTGEGHHTAALEGPCSAWWEPRAEFALSGRGAGGRQDVDRAVQNADVAHRLGHHVGARLACLLEEPKRIAEDDAGGDLRLLRVIRKPLTWYRPRWASPSRTACRSTRTASGGRTQPTGRCA